MPRDKEPLLPRWHGRNVYGPGEETPPPGKKEPFFMRGGLITLIAILFTLWLFHFSSVGRGFKNWLGITW